MKRAFSRSLLSQAPSVKSVLELLDSTIGSLRCGVSPRASLNSRAVVSIHSTSHHRKRKRQSSYEGNQPINPSLSATLALPKTPTADLLPLLSVELRSYQLSGVRWLGSHFIQGQNTILSDEQQADRQVQAIGAISFLSSRNIGGPFLIVSSAELLPSWSSELHRLIPSGLLLHTYDGSSSSEQMLGLVAGNRMDPLTRCVLVTPELFHSNRQTLCRHAFKLVVIDSSGNSHSPSQCLENTFRQPLSTQDQCAPILLLLTDAHPARSLSQPIQDLWPLIKLIVPDHFDRIFTAVNTLISQHSSFQDSHSNRDQNKSLPSSSKYQRSDDDMHLCDEDDEDEEQSIMSDLLSRLQDIVDQRVLSRSAAQFDLTLPRRDTNVNLYDLFSNLNDGA